MSNTKKINIFKTINKDNYKEYLGKLFISEDYVSPVVVTGYDFYKDEPIVAVFSTDVFYVKKYDRNLYMTPSTYEEVIRGFDKTIEEHTKIAKIVEEMSNYAQSLTENFKDEFNYNLFSRLHEVYTGYALLSTYSKMNCEMYKKELLQYKKAIRRVNKRIHFFTQKDTEKTKIIIDFYSTKRFLAGVDYPKSTVIIQTRAKKLFCEKYERLLNNLSEITNNAQTAEWLFFSDEGINYKTCSVCNYDSPAEMVMNFCPKCGRKIIDKEK